MNYEEWLEEHYSHLYEIYYHIIIPSRNRLRESNKVASIVTFSEFCKLGFETHGARLVPRRNPFRR
jgi:hypothetical protein